MLFLNHAFLDTRLLWASSRQVQLIRGLQDRVEANCGRLGWFLALPLPFASFSLAFPFTLERVVTFIGAFAFPFSLSLPGFLRHGCAVLGCRLPEQAEVERVGEGKGEA